MWDPFAEFQSATLPNGLTVHAAHWPERPWEAMGFLIHSGAEHDPVGLEGLSHFVEHLVFHNTKIPNNEMRVFFEDYGGMLMHGTTGYPHSLYGFFAPADRTILARAFSMFGHMLFSAKLEKFIEREREVIIGEFHQHYPYKFNLNLDIRMHKALYAGYWLERFTRPLGDPESVGRISHSDLQSHYDRHYTPANVSIVGVGGMKLLDLVELISESPFAISKKGIRTPLPSPATDVSPPSESRYVFEVSKHITTEIPVEVGAYLSVAKISGNANTRAIRIMKEMLNKLLNEEIREQRAWTYDIYCLRINYRHFYKFTINCRALSLKAINNIEEVIEVCIASLEDREDLFEQAKRRELAHYLMIDPTGKGICDDAIYDLAYYQRIISLVELRDGFESVTMSDIRNLLKWLRPEMRWTLITRP